MKTQNKLVLLTLTAIAAMVVTQTGAQYRSVGNDGIAASPKVRQMLDERARSTFKPRPAVTLSCFQATAGKGIAVPTPSCGQCCGGTREQPQPAPTK